jgi:hypothetical protein
MTKKSESVLVDTVPVLEPQNKNDLEAMVPESSSIILWSPTSVAATLALMCSAIGLGLRSLALETAVDGTYFRLALLVMLPIIFFMGLVSYFMSFWFKSVLKILQVYDAKHCWMSHANVWPS